NIQGKREVPDHPLVNQTIHDCLTEAIDIDELTELIGRIERRELNLVAKDLREPSPFAQEIINARPYAFLDDAPFEERRTNAIKNRSWLDPAETDNLAVLDPEAIRLVREQAWPLVANVDELHDALLSLSFITASEIVSFNYSDYLHQLISQQRACQLVENDRSLWIAAERVPCWQAACPTAKLEPEPRLPDNLRRQQWQREDAVREIVRGRLEGSGPVTASQLADASGLVEDDIQAALLGLEVEGYVFRGQFTPGNAGNQPAETEWCERRLLQRIHRYTIDAHRKAIKPVSMQNYLQFLFERHQLKTDVEESGPDSLPLTIDGQTRLQASLALLDGIAAPAAAWEADIFPARIQDYDPNWLDVMCISGRVAWGRFSPPAGKIAGLQRRKAGPIRSTPIILASRENLDIWQALAAQEKSAEDVPQPAHEAALIEKDLARHGASFVADIQNRTGLLKTQIEQGLAELVSLGRATSDSFTGLRALLTPSDRKPVARSRSGRRAMFGIEDAGRWSLLRASNAEIEIDDSKADSLLSNEQLERLVHVYLQRWGVVFRKVLERESFAPPWRDLLRGLRRMELQGTLRGGRFIAGISGEQFAYGDTVDVLRKVARQAREGKAREYVALAAADPLNLLNLILPDSRLPRVANNRVLFRDGVPLAVLQGNQVSFLRDIAPEQQWKLQQLLLQRRFPPRLRSYLGKRVH
ncbi:MAG: ATP-dependent DNA helicase, partial [Gammaproteobacteria bacterium]|nr:ATP-dependent DNA helicase [Gammaproteobacteria bacterium]